jgi:hypothetical protein
VKVGSSPTEVLSVLGSSDAGNYLRAALDLQDFRIEPANDWILNLWPPAQIIVLSITLKLSLPPVITLLILLAFLWSLVAVYVIEILLQKKFRLILVPIFAYFWLTGSPLNGWNQSEGALATDGIGTAVLCLLVIYLFKSLAIVSEYSNAKLFKSGIYCAFALSFLAHLKIAFLASILFTFTLLLGKITYIFIVNLLSRRSLKLTLSSLFSSNNVKYFIVILLSFTLLSAPFTLYKIEKTGSPSWSNSDYVWAHRWMPDKYLLENNAGFIVNGSGNWACKIDHKRCAQIFSQEMAYKFPYSGFGPHTYSDFRNSSMTSILREPSNFLENRLNTMIKTFTSSAGASVGAEDNLVRGVIYALLLIYVLSMSALTRRRFEYIHLINFGLLIGLLLPVIVTQFETRYLMPIQALSLVYFFLTISSEKTKRSSLIA